MANGDVKDLTVAVLKKIHGELVALRGEVTELRSETTRRLDRVQAELVHIRRDAMKRDTAAIAANRRIDRVEARLDKLESDR